MKIPGIFIIILVLFFLAVFGYKLVSGFLSTVNPEAMIKKAADRLETLEAESNPARLNAKLSDVSGGDSTGVAFIERGNAVLNHGVAADLPELEGNNFYEGWLVKQQPELEFFSTGDMILQTDGAYTIDFTSKFPYEDYNFVAVTLETIKDATPEKHILEGLAK